MRESCTYGSARGALSNERPYRYHRREFITLLGGAAAWPLAARAQQATMPVIGYLRFGEQRADAMGALRKGLGEQGYFEGRNFVFEPRTTEDYDRLPALAAELVARRVAAIFTFPPANAAQAAKAATSVIPIVFTTGADPILQGLVCLLYTSPSPRDRG